MIEIPLAIVIIIIYLFTSYSIHLYKNEYGSSPWIHESSIAALLGVIVGGFIKIIYGITIKFDSDLFFFLVLPPIIFSAGYSLKRRNFFRYMHLISLFGFFGTVINFVILTLFAYYCSHYFLPGNKNALIASFSWQDALLLASVLSASDEVSAMSLLRMKEYPRMGALIFGEGICNDALSIVIFKALLDWRNSQNSIQYSVDDNSLGRKTFMINIISTVIFQLALSCFIGLSLGLINARIFRSLPSLRQYPVHQSSLVLLFGYLAYFVAEAVHVSGILTLFAAAITLAHYSWHSLSKTSQLATKISFQSLSDIAEAFTFCYVGLSLWTYNLDNFDYLFSLYMLLIVVSSRFFVTFFLCWIFKWIGRDILPFNEQCGFAAAGVVRGCLCWAQVLQIGNNQLLVTTTMVIVMITTIASGFILPIFIPLMVNPVSKLSSVSLKQSIELSETKKKLNDVDKQANTVGVLPELDISTYTTHLDKSDIEESNIVLSPNNDEITGEEKNQIGRVYAVIYLLWIRFDETIMKPVFGGSRTDETRSFLLQETKSMSMFSIISSATQIKQIVRAGVDIQSQSKSPFKKVNNNQINSIVTIDNETKNNNYENIDVSNNDEDDIFLKDEFSIIGISSPLNFKSIKSYDTYKNNPDNINFATEKTSLLK